MSVIKERPEKESTKAGAEGDNQILSPSKRPKDPVTTTSNTAAVGSSTQAIQKRQRLELLTQIKYTLIYDERIDKPVVDKILADYEKKQKQSSVSDEIASQNESNSQTPKEGAVKMAAEFDSNNDAEGAGNEVNKQDAMAPSTDEMQLFREIVEEEKLDEQAAKKEEIEAAENEECGIMPQPLMLMQPLANQVISDEDDEDEMDSDEDAF